MSERSPAAPMKLLFVGSEVSPFAKTGGLADVLGALPRALAQRGHECAVMLPLYRCARQAPVNVEPTDITFDVPVGEKLMPARLWRSCLPKSDVPVYLIEQSQHFDRDDPALGQGLYQFKSPKGELKDYADNCERFVFLSRAILEALPALDFWPDVIHCNDWHTALVPVYLREVYGQGGQLAPRVDNKPNSRSELATLYAGITTLLTIHNLAYQGTFWHWDLPLTGLDWKLYNWQQLESHNRLNFLKGGIVFADAVSAVSERYAQEIQTPEFGCGLEDVLQHHRDKLVGIMNGVDYDDWNPATDPHIAARYEASSVATGKRVCKQALQQAFRLPPRPDVPLFGVVSRLTEQKGLELIAGAAKAILQEDLQLVVLGTGEAKYHNFLNRLQARRPDRIGVRLGFDEPLAHQIEAGADAFLMPSKFEPSGLNQLYSLKYGTIPVVRDTGGLSDSVTDLTPKSVADGTATGIKFTEYSPAAFLSAVKRTLALYREQPDLWRQVQQIGMKQDWSWARSAAKYEEVYRRLRKKTNDAIMSKDE
jgi:starch synthase